MSKNINDLEYEKFTLDQDWNIALNAVVDSSVDEKVKADINDSVSWYLSDKMDGSTLEVDTTNHKVRIKDWAITNVKIADWAIDSAKIADLNVDTVDIKDWAVTIWKTTWIADKTLSNVNDSDVINKVKNVDGAWSGLDADLLDGQEWSAYEKVANKVSAFQTTPDDTHYPTEKLVKDNLNLKADDNAVVHTTWNETISWEKTFNDNVWINTTNPTERLEVSWNIKTTAEFRQITTSRAVGNDKRVKNWNNNGWIKFVEYIDADWAVVWNKTWQLWGYPLQSSDWAAVWYDRFLSVWYDNYTEDSNWKSLWTQQKWFQVNASKHLLLDWNVWINTSTPTEKLEVNGNTVITWAKVNVANIPTSDPSVAWDLWNDNWTVKISAW